MLYATAMSASLPDDADPGPPPPRKPVSVLRFDLGSHPFALLLADVQELLRAVAVTPLPDAPASVLGVIDLRGDLVPVYDLRPRLGLPSAPVRTTDVFVVVGLMRRLVVLKVDRVEGIEEVTPAGVEALGLRFTPSALVAGVVPLVDGTRVLYDLDGFLTELEQTQLETALASSLAPDLA